MPTGGNLLGELPSQPLAKESIETLCERPGVRIERIVSTGQATRDGQWYDQSTDEWVMIVKGRARIRIEGEDRDRELGEGDYIPLPAHCRHRVTWTDEANPTVWLAIHFAASGSRTRA